MFRFQTPFNFLSNTSNSFFESAAIPSFKHPGTFSCFSRSLWPVTHNTGCLKSLGHILTLNMSKTIKEITMHLVYLKACSVKFFIECSKMFNVNTVSHTPHIKPIVKFLLKCVPALCCLWLQVATTSVIRP